MEALILNSSRYGLNSPTPATDAQPVLWRETFPYSDNGSLAAAAPTRWTTSGTEPYQVAGGKASLTGAVSTGNASGYDKASGFPTFDATKAYLVEFDFFCADAGTVGAFGISAEVKPEGKTNLWGILFFIANGGIVVGAEQGTGLVAGSQHSYPGTGAPSGANGHWTIQRAAAGGIVNVFKDGLWVFTFQPTLAEVGQYPTLFASGSLPVTRPGACTFDNLAVTGTAG
jgi:hypothetical protein